MRAPYVHVADLTSTDRRGTVLEVRVLFACQRADEAAVRSRIDTALARQWQVLTVRRDDVSEAESEHAAWLVVS
jgi:hypothetical protein